jgi:hypothetical protein
MRVLILGALAAVSAHFTSVSYVHYEDANCEKAVATITRPVGECIKEMREGHFRLLACSEGIVSDTEYSDAKCLVPVLKGQHKTNVCHEGAGRSLKLACGAATSFTAIKPTWDERKIATVTPFNSSAACVSRDTVIQRLVDKANGQYCECVCPHLSPWRCDCSGITSYAWELAAPGQVTQTLPNYSARLAAWTDMKPGDIILKPDQHVEVFRVWESGTSTFGYCGCHNTADGCSCRTGSTASYWQGAGYYPAKGNMVC